MNMLDIFILYICINYTIHIYYNLHVLFIHIYVEKEKLI